MAFISELVLKVRKKRKKTVNETYNTKDSLVVTDPTTDLALTSLSMGERTGSRVLQWVWSYVAEFDVVQAHILSHIRFIDI
jgi:hypothetical protein